MDGSTANSLAPDHHGPLQDDQAVTTELLRGSCLRGLDQGLGPTRASCSRNRPLEPLCTMARLAQGWAGHPCHIRRMPLTATGTPAPDVDALCLVTRWANRKVSTCFTSLAPLRRRAARGSSAHGTRPWPWRGSLRGWSAVFLKPQCRAQAERPGFPTARDHGQRRLGRALLMDLCPSSTGAQHGSERCSAQHNARAPGHKALPELADQNQRSLASAGPVLHLLHRVLGS
jgi:hypothetical protein